MVVPLLPEAAWLPHLQPLPEWQPTDAPLLVIAPHPDDETLAAGGLIAAHRSRGLPVTVVAVTDGEHAYAANAGLAALRREEQTRALARLGVPAEKIIRLGLTDSSVAAHEEQLTQNLASLVTSGTQIVAPWAKDFHPDHEACARAAQTVAIDAGVPLISYFFWTWHCGTPTHIADLMLRKFPLSPNQLNAKLEALTCHDSQLHHAPETEILPDNLLWPAHLTFEIYAL
jgi:LmbE family N-acetylglucosaminyl deacetylase